MKRGVKMPACDRLFDGENAAVSSKIEKHHHCYLRLCIGNFLPSDSDDIYRTVKDGEFPLAPDCRRCKAENPEYYQGCIKKIFPVHGKCHEDIHELEKLLFTNIKKKLRADFFVSCEFIRTLYNFATLSALFFVVKEIKSAVSRRTNEVIHDWPFELSLQTTKVPATIF
jgi:hypothetical protein